MSSKTGAEWRDFFLAHMPPGDALDLDEGSTFYAHFEALAMEVARFDALVDELLVELDPRSTFDFVGDWERSLDLPRDCQTPTSNLTLRRAQLCGVITRQPNVTKDHLIEAAALFGHNVAITEYVADGDSSKHFKYDATVTGSTFINFLAGEAVAGDPLGFSEELDLECLLDEIEPAWAEHTIL